MITFLLILALTISIGFSIASVILIRILSKKIFIYQKWIIMFKENLNTALKNMREIDKQGTFST